MKEFLKKIVRNFNRTAKTYISNIRSKDILLIVYRGTSFNRFGLITVDVFYKNDIEDYISYTSLDIHQLDYKPTKNDILYKNELFADDEDYKINNIVYSSNQKNKIREVIEVKSIINWNGNIITNYLTYYSKDKIVIDYTNKNLFLLDEL